MKYRITLDIKDSLESDDHKVHVQAKHEYMDGRSLIFLREIFLVILQSCKKADKEAFYHALERFIVEDLDDLDKTIEEERAKQ